MTEKLTTIGRNTPVDIIGHAQGVPAKVDTGADSSSIWASHVTINEQGMLSFVLFDEKSPFYTGNIITTDDYRIAAVRSSTGHEQIRYKVKLSLSVNGRNVRAAFNLSDRSRNKFPILIGRRTLAHRFLVDVSLVNYREIETEEKLIIDAGKLNKLSQTNPYDFYKKFYAKDIT